MMEKYDDTFPAAKVDEQIDQLSRLAYRGPLQDTPGSQTVQALHALSRSNERDQRSVERAWTRIIAETARQESDQSGIAGQVFVPTPIKSQLLLPRYHQHALTRYFNVLVMLVVFVVLLSGFIAVFHLTQQTASNRRIAIVTPRPIATSASTALSTGLGGISLGMSKDQVMEVVKINTKEAYSIDQHLYLTATGGLNIRLLVNDAQQSKTGVVDQISVSAPFSDSTAEGFRLGMPAYRFSQLYQHFQTLSGLYNLKPGISQQCVNDSAGTFLCTTFDKKSLAISLTLQTGQAGSP